MRKATMCLLLVFASVITGLARSSGVPIVVARFKLLNQSGPITSATIYTPKWNGIFRITTVMVLTASSNGGGYWEPALGFTDRLGIGTTFATDYYLTTQTKNTLVNGTHAVIDHAGQPLTFSTVSSGDTSGSKYDVFIVVERIGSGEV
jgi:hypothetical protein